jgi:hypothetical protein
MNCPKCGTEINPAAEMGKVGGKAKSEAKSAASRANAKKGGWPKGRPRKPVDPVQN